MISLEYFQIVIWKKSNIAYVKIYCKKTGRGDEPLYPSLGTALLTFHWLILLYFVSLSHAPTALWPPHTLGWSSEDLCLLMCPVYEWRLLGNNVENAYSRPPSPSSSSPSISRGRNVSRKHPWGKQLTEASKLVPKLTELHRSFKISWVRSTGGGRKLALFSFMPHCMFYLD